MDNDRILDKDGKLQEGLNYSHVIHTSCEGCDKNPIHLLCRNCYAPGLDAERKNYTPVPPVTYTSCPDCEVMEFVALTQKLEEENARLKDENATQNIQILVVVSRHQDCREY